MTLTFRDIVAQYEGIQSVGGNFNYYDVRKKVSDTATVLKTPGAAARTRHICYGSKTLAQCVVLYGDAMSYCCAALRARQAS